MPSSNASAPARRSRATLSTSLPVPSIYSPVTFHQDSAFLAIGERMNANSSKKFKNAMIAGDWDITLQLAKEQVKEGAHVLDVCVDYVGRGGTEDMAEIVSRVATQAGLPLVLDSTEPQVLEAGLQHIGGKPVLNSANLEEGEEPGKRFDRVMSLAREYGAAVVCMCIDEDGQARTADRKVEIARRIRDLAVERYGIEALRPALRLQHPHARHRHRGEPERRHRDDRGDPSHQERDPRRVDRARAVEHQLRVQALGPPRAQQRVPPRMP